MNNNLLSIVNSNTHRRSAIELLSKQADADQAATQQEFISFMSAVGLAVQRCKVLDRPLYSEDVTDVCLMNRIPLPRIDSKLSGVCELVETLLHRLIPTEGSYCAGSYLFSRLAHSRCAAPNIKRQAFTVSSIYRPATATNTRKAIDDGHAL